MFNLSSKSNRFIECSFEDGLHNAVVLFFSSLTSHVRSSKMNLETNPLQLLPLRVKVVFDWFYLLPSSHAKTSTRHCPKPKENQTEIKSTKQRTKFVAPPIGKFSTLMEQREKSIVLAWTM